MQMKMLNAIWKGEDEGISYWKGIGLLFVIGIWTLGLWGGLGGRNSLELLQDFKSQ